MNRKYKMIDLCAGIGGIRRGYELAGGFVNVLSAENDKNACLTYKRLYGDDPMNDITTDEFKDLVADTEYDVLLAGFPCQPFSRAGKEEGFHDKTRGTLFFDIAEIISKTTPKAFMLENVDNLITHQKGHTFATIIDVLVNDLDYKVIGVTKDDTGKLVYNSKNFVRNSRNFGVPQNRPRVYIMGFSRKHFGNAVDDLPNTLPTERKEKIYKDLNDLLEMNADDKYFLSEGYVSTLEKHRARHEGKGNGFGYKIVNLPEIESPVSNALLATGGSGKERNLVIDPKEGVAGKIIGSKQTPLNDRGIRTMTPREWGKLQGFINYAFVDKKTGKDKFCFPDGLADGPKYKQFGNAVTIPVVEEMAKFMKECLSRFDRNEVLIMVANKGEWGEPYVALRLLGNRKIFLADDNNMKNPNEWMNILELIRHEAKDRIVTYKYDDKGKYILIDVNGKMITTIPVNDFLKMADILHHDVINARGRSFTVSKAVTDFLKKAEFTTLKAKNIDKSDIFLSVADPRSSVVRKSIGFSIKTKFGQDPTLFNTAKASGVKYELHNMSDNIMEEINNTFNSKGEVSVTDRCRLIKEKQLNPTYCGYAVAKKSNCEAFKENLEVLNPILPNVIERMLWYHFFDEVEGIDIQDIIKIVIDKNPCGITRPDIKYPYMLKAFLYASYCGMTASTLWDGRSQVNGGFISVGSDGEVLAYYALESEKFKNYLYNNCYLEFPATSEKHGDYGKVYKDVTNNKYFFNLNFQIRYR